MYKLDHLRNLCESYVHTSNSETINVSNTEAADTRANKMSGWHRKEVEEEIYTSEGGQKRMCYPALTWWLKLYIKYTLSYIVDRSHTNIFLFVRHEIVQRIVPTAI